MFAKCILHRMDCIDKIAASPKAINHNFEDLPGCDARLQPRLLGSLSEEILIVRAEAHRKRNTIWFGHR